MRTASRQLWFQHMVSHSNWSWPLHVTSLAWPHYPSLSFSVYRCTHLRLVPNIPEVFIGKQGSWGAHNPTVGSATSIPNKNTFTSMSNGHMARNVENSLRTIQVHTHISGSHGVQERSAKQVWFFFRGLTVFLSHINHHMWESPVWLSGDASEIL